MSIKIKYYMRGTISAQPEHDTRKTEWVPIHNKEQIPYIANALINFAGAERFMHQPITLDTFKDIWRNSLNCPYMSLTDSARYCTIEVIKARPDGAVPENYLGARHGY